jgi:hypothetical protein
MKTFTVVVPGVPPSVNQRMSHHWSKAAEVIRLYRTVACVATKDAIDESEIDVVPWLEENLRLVIWHYPETLRGDAHNREKCVVDGIVDGLNLALEMTVKGQRSRKIFNDSRVAICSTHPQRRPDAPCVVCEVGPEDQFSFDFSGRATT